MSNITIIESASPSIFNNRYSIYCADPYNYQEISLATIQQLADQLGAVNPLVVRTNNQLGSTSLYLLADKFSTIQSEIDQAFIATNEFDYEGEFPNGAISYLVQVNSNHFLSGYPVLFWGKELDDRVDVKDQWGHISYEKMQAHATVSKETLQIIEWLETEEDSLKCYLDLSKQELIEVFSDYMYNALNHKSIADTVLALINITLQERVDWQHVINYLKGRQEGLKLVQWVKDNFEPAGSGYYLSTNPNDFNQYDRSLLLATYNRLNNTKVEMTDHLRYAL